MNSLRRIRCGSMKSKLTTSFIAVLIFCTARTAYALITLDQMNQGFVAACGANPTNPCASNYWNTTSAMTAAQASYYSSVYNGGSPYFWQQCNADPAWCWGFQLEWAQANSAFSYALAKWQYWLNQ